MKTHRHRIAVKKFARGKKSRSPVASLRSTLLVGLEHLELRALLTAASSVQGAWQDSADPWTADTDALSIRSMLASCDRHSCNTSDSSARASASPLAAMSFTTMDSPSDESGDNISSASEEESNASAAPLIEPLVGEFLATFRLEAQDLNNNPITSILVGQAFQLAGYIEDTRDPPNGSPGLGSAFMNITYDSSKVTVTAQPNSGIPSDPGNNADLGIDFFGYYNAGLRYGNLETAGQIIDIGSAPLAIAVPPTGEQLMWRFTATASAAGTVQFVPALGTNIDNETLFFNPVEALTSEQIDFMPASLQITALPTVSITPAVSHDEGNTGTSPATPYVFTVSLSDASAQEVTVAYATSLGTGQAGDFVAQSATLTFAPSETSKTVTISVVGDTEIELDETFNVALSNPTNATLGTTATGVGTIVNDDSVVIGVANVSQSEGDGAGNMVFTVTISQPSPTAVLVPFQTVDQSATSIGPSADYTPTSGTVTFAAGAGASQLVTVAINGDNTNEQNEDFRLVLTQPANAVFDDSDGQAVGTILNDEGTVIGFSQQAVSVAEGDDGTTAILFTVVLSEETAIPVTVQFSSANGTGTAPSDYTATSGTVAFEPGGALSQVVTVLVNGDELSEADEDFVLNLTNPVNATVSQSSATGTIENDDPLPGLSFQTTPVTTTEGNTGSNTMVFTVNLSEASGQAVTVQFATVNGTASTSDNDYLAGTGALTFAPGDTQELITIAINGDNKDEPNESFTLDLFNAVGASNATSPATKITATGTILDNDDPPTLTINDETHTEADDSTRFYFFTATLSAASGHTITVPFATADGTATAATNDYTPTSGTITFAPGQTSKVVTVLSNGDFLHEQNETFLLNLTPSDNVVLARIQAVGTIEDEDPEPELVVTGGGPKSEGNTETTNVLFTVSLTTPSGQSVVVDFTTTDGTATVTNNDFVGQTGKLTFAPAETSKVVTVAINGDTRNETDETFSLVLSNPVNARLSTGAVGNPFAQALILNDDALPSLSINDVTLAEGNSGNTAFVFQVTLSPLSGQSVTVVFATANGTATTSNNDYVATSGTLTFAPGVGTQNVTVQVKGDMIDEADETFVVNLSSPTNATLGDAQGTGTIQDEAGDNIVFTPSTISGKLFVDVDDSNEYETGEDVLSARTVTLTGTSTITSLAVNRTSTTDASGNYSFGELEPGNYQVTIQQPAGFLPAEVLLGSSLPVKLTSGIGYSVAISGLGGINSTNNNFAVLGSLPSMISQRPFTSSAQFARQAAASAAASASQATALLASTAGGSEAQITQNGGTVTIRGTSSDDVFAFEAGSSHTVRVNGVTRQFSAGAVTNFVFEGGGGQDAATWTGSSGAETAEVGVGSGSFIGADFVVSVDQVSSLTIHGNGGQDAATLTDSALSDHLQAAGNEVSLTNSLDETTRLLAFAQVEANSVNGGDDTSSVGTIDFALEQQGDWLTV